MNEESFLFLLLGALALVAFACVAWLASRLLALFLARDDLEESQ